MRAEKGSMKTSWCIEYIIGFDQYVRYLGVFRGCLILSRFYSVSSIPDEAQGGLWDESASGGTGER